MAQRQDPALLQGVGLLLAADHVVFAQEHPAGLAGTGEGEPVAGEGPPRLQGDPEAGVGPQAKVHLLFVPVLHPVGDREGGTLQAKDDVKGKGPGVAGAGLGAVGHAQGDLVRALVQGGEHGPAGKAVAGHGVGPAAAGIAVLGQAAHVGEQVGGAVAPVGRVPAPEVLRSVAGGDGHQLRAQLVNGHGQPIAADCVLHHSFLHLC